MTQPIVGSCVYCGEEYTFNQYSSNLVSIFMWGNQDAEDNQKNNSFSNR